MTENALKEGVPGLGPCGEEDLGWAVGKDGGLGPVGQTAAPRRAPRDFVRRVPHVAVASGDFSKIYKTEVQSKNPGHEDARPCGEAPPSAWKSVQSSCVKDII